MIRTLAADSHQLIREGIKTTLEREEAMSVVAEAWDISSLLAVLEKEHVDVVLLDLDLTPQDELAGLRTIRAQYPSVPVIVLTAHSEYQFGIASMRAGARAYLTKSMPVDVLANAVRLVHANGHYVSEALAGLMARELASPTRSPPHKLLTKREYEVFLLLGQGFSVKQISSRLEITISTTNTYRTRILTKMAMDTNAELIRYVINERLST